MNDDSGLLEDSDQVPSSQASSSGTDPDSLDQQPTDGSNWCQSKLACYPEPGNYPSKGCCQARTSRYHPDLYLYTHCRCTQSGKDLHYWPDAYPCPTRYLVESLPGRVRRCYGAFWLR